MGKKPVPVHVVPHTDGWAVVREGSSRARSIHPTQRAAAEVGRATTHTEKTELVLYGRDGQARKKESHIGRRSAARYWLVGEPARRYLLLESIVRWDEGDATWEEVVAIARTNLTKADDPVLEVGARRREDSFPQAGTLDELSAAKFSRVISEAQFHELAELVPTKEAASTSK